MLKHDVLIVGGGIIGCSLARELARANLRVVVLESGPIGMEASSAAAGLLSPSLMAAHAGPMLSLCLDAAEMYERWVEELLAQGGQDVGFRRWGLLEVWTQHEEVKTLEQLRPLSRERVEVWPVKELVEKEPAIAPDVFGAAYYGDDAQVEPAKLMPALARACEHDGVHLREREPVLNLTCAGHRVTTVQSSLASYHPGCVVLTAGAWTSGLAGMLGLHLPVVPVKGQMLQADCRLSPVRIPIAAGEALFVPRADGSLSLGVTVEDVGFDRRPTLEGVSTIVELTRRVVPSVSSLGLGRTWAGLRPSTPDGLPYMGPALPFENLWVSAGHFRKGILLAPVAARLMAQSILAGRLVDELEPFKPTRRIV